MPCGAAVFDEHPVGAIAALLVVATVVYVALSSVLVGRVDVVETGGFAVVFTVAYTAFTYYAER